jgi:hypothetical protein
MNAYAWRGRPLPAALTRIPIAVREAIIAACITAVGTAVLLLATPYPDDASAHLYRALLVERDAIVWDNLWYGGDYPFLSYSLLAYLPQGVIGPDLLAILSVIASAAFFAALVVSRFGPSAVWGARAGGLFVLGPLFTGGYAYAIGAAAMLACLLALEHRHLIVGALLGAATLGLSPLAFGFLMIVLLGVLLDRRRLDPRTLVIAGWLGALALLQLAIGWFFPSTGIYPFKIGHLIAVLAIAVLGAALARRRPETRLIMWILLVWIAACLVLYAVSSPIGDNVARLRYFAFPLMLVLAAGIGWRPRWAVGALLAITLAYGAIPDLIQAATRNDERPATEEFWAPAVGFLEDHMTPDYRVEVVQTSGRWEAYWIPEAGFPLVRGWYRQVDLVENPVLYQEEIAPYEFRRWLDSRAVRYVLLPDTPLDSVGAQAEADLLRSGSSGLELVSATGDWLIYEVPDPTPLMTGPGEATITLHDHERLVGRVDTPGRYVLRVRWMPYWEVRGVVTCVEEGWNRQTLVTVDRPGTFVLAAPDADEAVGRALESGPASSCP